MSGSIEIPPGSGSLGGVVWSKRPPKEWARSTPQARGRGVWVYIDGETIRRAFGRLPELRLEVKRTPLENGSAKVVLTFREAPEDEEEE